MAGEEREPRCIPLPNGSCASAGRSTNAGWPPGRKRPDERRITYNVRVYRTKVYKGSRVTTYKVRWKVGARSGSRARTAAQADSFRSSLLTAARNGEAFSLATGRPIAWERAKAAMTWYEFACTYADMK